MQSCKTYAKSSLYGHLHAKLVTVCEYEQNASMSVGVAHTRYIQRDLQMDVHTYVQRSANINAHPQFCQLINNASFEKSVTSA